MRIVAYMKKWTASLGLPVVLLPTAMIILSGCQPPERKTEQVQAVTKYDLPVSRKLTNKRGKTVDVRVIARLDDELVIIRESDDQEFRYPIADLAKRDADWAKSLPFSHSEEEVKGDSYVDFRVNEIIKLEAKIAELTLKLNRFGDGHSQRKAIANDISRAKREIAELREQVKKYQRQ